VNFFLDHDVPTDVGRVLRLKGHSVQLLEEVLPRTTDDHAALQYAASQALTVITCNRRGFLRLARTEPHAGIIILIRVERAWQNVPRSCASSSEPAKVASAITSTSLEPEIRGVTMGLRSGKQ
jgi:hypothetical protein